MKLKGSRVSASRSDPVSAGQLPILTLPSASGTSACLARSASVRSDSRTGQAGYLCDISTANMLSNSVRPSGCSSWIGRRIHFARKTL